MNGKHKSRDHVHTSIVVCSYSMSSLERELLMQRLPPSSAVASNRAAGTAMVGRRSRLSSRDYSPTSWDGYFDSCDDFHTSNDNVFRVYRVGDSGPRRPLLVLLHGGGYSGLTWALLAADIIKLVECQVAAIDLRGHGSSSTTDDEDLCAETMSSDIGQILEKMFAGTEAPPIILMGHSMGGAIAVHTSHRQLVPSIVGLVVIDVVEGTAMDALQSMQSFLRGRPTSFVSVAAAVEWCVRTGQVRNLESVKVSMPGQLKSVSTGKVATDDLLDPKSLNVQQSGDNATHVLQGDSNIPEEDEEVEEKEKEADQKSDHSPKKSKTDDFKVPPATRTMSESARYTWRIDLSKTEKHWTGWFRGLSNMFLECSSAKLLLLAGVDRLDKDLTIGQMQGKFQMQVLPQCGHAVQEDVPDKVAEVLASFLVRNKFAQPLDTFQV